MIYLDTSSLIRFFTKDNLASAKKVKDLLEKETEIYINDVVFPELDYVLRKIYNLQRSDVVIAYKFILSCQAIRYSKIIPEAALRYESSNLSMADCIIAAASLNGQLASFDKQMLNIPGVTKY